MLSTGHQLRAARALIGIDQTELAKRAGLNVSTIRRMEASAECAIAGRSTNVHAVQRVLEAAGIELLNHGQPGVRLQRPTDHLKPVGPATDMVKAMDAAIEEHKAKKR